MNDGPHVTGRGGPSLTWLTAYKPPVSAWLQVAQKWFHSRAVLFRCHFANETKPLRKRLADPASGSSAD
jgi:hypothetical protein